MKLRNILRHYMPYVLAVLLVFSVMQFYAYAKNESGDQLDTADQLLKDTADELDKDTADELPTKTDYQYEDQDIKVVATLEKADALADQAKLTASRITNTSKGFNYQAYMNALNKDSKMTHNDENTLLYGISFKLDGKEVEPDDGKVKINVFFKKKQLSKDLAINKPDALTITHFKDNDVKKTEVLQANTDINKDTTSFETKSLSVIALVNTTLTENGKGEIQSYGSKSKAKRVVRKQMAQTSSKTENSNNNLAVKISDSLPLDPGYGVIVDNYYQTGDTESNVCVNNYYSTASDVGASTNYAENGGDIYIGNVVDGSANLIRPHISPANIYLGTDATTSYQNKWDFENINGTSIHENVTNIHPMNIISDMASTYQTVADHGQEIYRHGENSNQQPTAFDDTVDLRDRPDGTYMVTYNGNNIDSSQYGNNWLNIHLNPNQHLVIYCPATELTIKDYKLNDVEANSYVTQQEESSDWLTKAVTFYAPNASKLNLTGGTCGIFLAPQATLYKDITCAGIMAIKNAGTVDNPMNGEWHYHNHDLPQPVTEKGGFSLTKKLAEANSQYADNGFKFKIILNSRALSGNFGDVHFSSDQQNDQSVGYVTLKPNQSITVSDLPVNTQYEIEEVLSDSDRKIFTPTYTIRQGNKDVAFTGGTITKNQKDDVTCTNTVEEKNRPVSLTLQKLVSGNQASTTKEFTFTINFEGNPDLSKASVKFNVIEDSIKVKSGMTVNLKDKDQVVISGLPKGIKYSISENPDGYTPSYKIDNGNSGDSSSTSTETLNADTAVTFTNTKNGTVVTGLTKQRLMTWPFVVAIGGALIYTMRKRKEK